MKVILYARVSTADQSDHGISLDAQQAKLGAYASLYDLTVVETIVDAGESAKSLNRPGLQRALDLLKAGKADGLAVVKLDRLTRSVADWQTLIDDYFGEKAVACLAQGTSSGSTHRRNNALFAFLGCLLLALGKRVHPKRGGIVLERAGKCARPAR